MGNIKLKQGYCPDCGNTEPKPLVAGYCQFHYWQSKKKPIVFKPKKISSFSQKKQKELATYRVLRDKYFKENPICEFKDCNSTEIDLHHKKSRKYHLCDVSIFMSLCRKHHNWVHENDKEARELGYILNSISND